ncbi:MAG: hypothetical protein IIT51_08710 [Oscillospiraceae bacterium]|nr:hypothetical protein [Oscillospiraceae bacterium]
MNRYGKKAVSMLLLLVMLCTITAMAAAEGEENTSGSEASTVITPDSGSTEAPTAGTSSTTPSENTGTAEATSGTEQVVIVLPDGPAAEDKKESADSATVSETGPGGASTTETAAQTETTAEATPTPTPSPSAAPKPASIGLPTVTKHPTDETVDIGGECVFIANYSNAIWAVWHFVSPDGKTDYRFDDKAMQTAFPGLKVENGMYSNMSLKNIPAELNGWRVCCEYRNNSGSVRTNYATVNVRGAEAALAAASPEPTPTPTPEPTPTPTPEPTPTPTPTPMPETNPNPTESPEEGREEASKSTEKRSGSHVILMLAAGFAVAAVVICGGILLIYKHRGE